MSIKKEELIALPNCIERNARPQESRPKELGIENTFEEEGVTSDRPARRSKWKANYGHLTIPEAGTARAIFKNAKAHRIPDGIGIEWERITRRITKDIGSGAVLEDVRPKDTNMKLEVGLTNLERCADIAVLVKFEDNKDSLGEKVYWADVEDEE